MICWSAGEEQRKEARREHREQEGEQSGVEEERGPGEEVMSGREGKEREGGKSAGKGRGDFLCNGEQ